MNKPQDENRERYAWEAERHGYGISYLADGKKVWQYTCDVAKAIRSLVPAIPPVDDDLSSNVPSSAFHQVAERCEHIVYEDSVRQVRCRFPLGHAGLHESIMELVAAPEGPTPRTDALFLHHIATQNLNGPAELLEHARQLERELAQLRHDMERSMTTNSELATENEQLRTRVIFQADRWEHEIDRGNTAEARAEAADRKVAERGNEVNIQINSKMYERERANAIERKVAELEDALNDATHGKYSELMLHLAKESARHLSRGLEICTLKGELLTVQRKVAMIVAACAEICDKRAHYRESLGLWGSEALRECANLIRALADPGTEGNG